MKSPKEEPDGFLTKEERSALLREITALSDVGFTIVDRTSGEVLANKVYLSDRAAFFGKAKLWRVIQGAVRAVFFKQLVEGHLFFTDEEGIRYYFSILHPSQQARQ